MRALLLPVGQDWYALDVTVVREVIVRPPVTRVPTGPVELVGLFNLRGEILPLLDTAVLLGLAPPREAPFAAVVRGRVGSAALTASAMPEAAELDDPITGEIVAGMTAFAVGARVVALVSVDGLFAHLGDAEGRP